MIGDSIPDLDGAYALPPGTNGDADRRTLLAQAVAQLYAFAGSAQRYEEAENDADFATHQIIIASSALAASSADAFLVLVSQGLEGPALIQLRSLGEIAIRVVVCERFRDLAAELYESWLPTFRKVAAGVIDGIPNPTAGEQTMQKLESLQRFKDARDGVVAELHMMSALESTILSKRAHGDIYAMLMVATALKARNGDIRAAVNIEMPATIAGNNHIMRAIGFVLVILTSLLRTFGINDRGAAHSIAEQYGAMLQRDEESGALVPPAIAIPVTDSAPQTDSDMHDEDHEEPPAR